jgi:hypothetical protein
MPVNWRILVKDIQDLAAMKTTAKHLLDSLNESELESLWKVFGKCGLCGTNIYFKVQAIFQRGQIMKCGVVDESCPTCQEDIHGDVLTHSSVHSHVS